MADGAEGPRDGSLSDEDLLVSLANTVYRETDELADPAALASWWGGLRGLPTSSPSSMQGLRALHDFRHMVRTQAMQHTHGTDDSHGGPTATRDLPTSLATLALRPHLFAGRVSLLPLRPGDLGADVTAIALTALLRAEARPLWRRVKACPGHDCGWVFIDASRNHSRRWCEMARCGNRAKTDTFRARQRRLPERGATSRRPASGCTTDT